MSGHLFRKINIDSVERLESDSRILRMVADYNNYTSTTAVNPSSNTAWKRDGKYASKIVLTTTMTRSCIHTIGEFPKPDKSIMFSSQYRTYRIPHDHHCAYIVNNRYYQYIVNYGSDIMFFEFLHVDCSYSELILRSHELFPKSS